ncbi:hypothetical protein DOE76_16465 [Leifsonia sp. ku-ls]|nr:hypothetical protein DOE76_16465 [Leifsonia sp. ku-ls]
MKTADASQVGSPAKVGDTVTYRFTSTNTGSTTLTNVRITDPLAGLSALTYTWPGVPGTLLPGQSVTATATYRLTQADIAAGHVVNTATTVGTPPSGPNVTDQSTADVPLTTGPAIDLVKTADASAISVPAKVGDTITYTFVSTNVGSTPLTGVTITDPLPGLSSLTYTWPAAPGTLLPGESVTATATYQLTAADVAAGHVANTATTGGIPPTGPNVTDQATADVPLSPAPSMTFVKTADASALSTPAQVGDTITYTFRSTNTGNTTLTNVTITDPLPGLSPLTYSWPGAPGTLQPGQTVTATATYQLTEADIVAGHVVNSAFSTGTPPVGPPVTPPPGTTDTPIPGSSAIDLLKTADASQVGSPAKPGDTVTYRFTSTNTGSTTLTGVTITDPLPGLSALTYSWPGTPGTLLPGQSVTATATYQLTAADIAAGHVANRATTTGTPPSGPKVTDQSTADVALTPAPGMTFTKTADASKLSTPAQVGDTITYTFVSTNTGNTTLTGVTITDPLPGLSALTYSWPGAPGTLLPGQSVTATATYTLTQADIDAGHVANSAFSTGTPPVGPPVTPPPGTTDTPLPPTAQPGMTFVKTADASKVSSPAQVGDTITYTFRSTNTGNTILTNVSISDPLPGLSPLAYSWPGTPGTLLPGQSVTATATYRITQADISAGHVANSAISTGTPPVGPPVTPPPGTTDTPLPAGPAIDLVKAADVSKVGSPAKVGDTITYRFTSTNTGNVPLTNVSIADPLPGLSALTYTWPGAPGTLLPGQSVTATATYRLTAADIAAGTVTNHATTTGTPPTGPAVTDEATVTVPLTPAPGIDLVKTADSSLVGAPARVGDTITYTFRSTNTGNVPLTNVSIGDPLPGLSALTYTWPGTPGTLLPGQSVTATATYRLTQGDIDAGGVHNAATSTGTPPSGPPVTDGSTVDVPLVTSSGIDLRKIADASAIGVPANVGDTITYHFIATNRGDTTLTNVSITDPLPGLSSLTYTWPGTPGTLLPGQSVTATATYRLTAADLAAGHVANTATAVGTPPSGPDVTDDSSADVPMAPTPAIALVKSADASALQSPAKAGDTITYTFRSTNTGNVPLTNVSIADPLPGLSALSYSWPGTPGALLPGQTVTATATYQLTEADIQAGHVVNTATTTGTPPSGPAVTDQSSVDVPVAAVPGLKIEKTADTSAIQSPAQPGDTITYAFRATNTGNVPLTGVAISDRLPGLSALTYTWPGAPGVLLPGQSVTAVATYQLTQSDIDAGHVANSATTVGIPPVGPPITPPPGNTDTPLPSKPSIDLVKTAETTALQSPPAVGDAVTYRFTATNTGDTTLTDVSIVDPLPGLSSLTYAWPGATGVLRPGQSVTATATYRLTQADIDAGTVTNRATAVGTPPSGPNVTDDASVEIPTREVPGLETVKTADASQVGSPAKVGDTITYHFTATNTGTSRLTNVSITDPLPGLSALNYVWPGAPGVLQPGESVTATATYQLTQKDIDAGHVTNSATSTGTPPAGPPVVTPPSVTDTPLAPDARLALVKTADASAAGSPARVGDVITYTFTATNTGNVTMTDVVITDPLPGLSVLTYTWPGAAGVLEPGQSVLATATYRLTQADIDAGHVANVAGITGTPPGGAPTPGPDASVDTTIPRGSYPAVSG